MAKSINDVVLSKLQLFAPLCLAESWDNVGMLIEPENEIKIKRILLTNDLTLNVLHEVKEKKVEMIVSYHPPLFQGFKRLRPNNWKELIVSRCVKNDLYVYSPHTALDSVNGGVNDWLLSVFDVTEKYTIQEYTGCIDQESVWKVDGDKQARHGGGRYCTLRRAISLSAAITLLKKHLGLEHLLLARGRNHNETDAMVSTVAVCAGSGTSLLKQCPMPVDLWITGEMSHHDLLDVTENMCQSMSVILTAGHSNSERGFLRDVLHPWLSQELSSVGVEVLVSEADRDPLTVV